MRLLNNWAVLAQPSGEALTQTELHARAERFARYLVTYEIKRVAFLMENRIECAELLLGAQAAGVDFLLLNNHSRNPGDLLGVIDDFKPNMLVATDTYATMAEFMVPEITHDIYCVMLGKPSPRWVPYELIFDMLLDEECELPGDGQHFPTSGGATGRQKVIQVPRPVAEGPPPIQSLRETDATDVVLITGPLHHGMHIVPMLAALKVGARVVIMERWDARVFLECVEAFGVTRTNIVPTMMQRLLELPDDVRAGANLSSLKRVMHAAAPCPTDVKAHFIEWFGTCVIEVYGMTEGFGFTAISAEEWLSHPGSVGRALPGHYVVIRDADGNALPAGTAGQIWFGHEHAMTRMVYLGHENESHDCYNDLGEGSAGDVGWLDEDGFLYITGRIKLMILVGGVNTFLEPTESFLLDQPEVSDVCAFGHSDEDLGERMSALVVLQPDVEPSEQLASYLIGLCHHQLGLYATPVRILFVDEVPRTPTGKMDRRAVATMVAGLQ